MSSIRLCPTLTPFKLADYGIINNPSFHCAFPTLSGEFNIHIPDVLLPDGITHLWVDLSYIADSFQRWTMPSLWLQTMDLYPILGAL